ncbi:MAG: shikimate dehydrogenase [Candidatus Aminicenantes bacterium]|nr:shikimate dehydrogenase [Candidatus Aminicenantes bacterium]
MPKPEIYAVTGKPVVHSLSPELFGLFFRTFNRNAVYTRLAADSALEALATARAIGLRGLNVTSPFKEEMVSLVDGLDEPAAKIGAVNCLALAGAGARGGQGRSVGAGSGVPSRGYNTDFIGLIGTLASFGVDAAGCRALILGTGGAGRAAAYGLVGAGAGKVFIAGRSREKARAAARRLGCAWARILDAPAILKDVDVCISCLPFPFSRVLTSPRRGGCLIVDAHYGSAPEGPAPGKTGPPAALRWLFHQAIPSFEILTGVKVDEGLRRKAWDEFASGKGRRHRHIALVGFMGAGKTTTGRQLAQLMGQEFIDTDEAIGAVAGMSITEIFKLRGESSFRSLEKSVIGKIVPPEGRRKVISVGGGAVLDEENRRTLTQNCRVVWLWTPARTAVARIDAATRPVLDPGRPLESAERTLRARLPLYASVADLIVNASVGSPLDVARRIQGEMDQAL